MAVSVDTVYQRVLALANKEQRGYITPQEFNLLANQAQMSIFESYFHTKNRAEAADANGDIEVDETSIVELLDRKLAPFSTVENVDGGTSYPSTVTVGSDVLRVFQIGRVFYNNQVCSKVTLNEAQRMIKSVRHISTNNNEPIYTNSFRNSEDILVYAGSNIPRASGVTAECFRVPKAASWEYVVVQDQALYNSNTAVDFELHKSEEDSLVIKILEMAGIVLNKVGLVQTASQSTAFELGSQVPNV